MKKRGSLIFIILLILIASFFRLYNLQVIPPSATVDEVSIGYNAYSLLNTGADEYGDKFPLLLRAYDDWRPALYVYLVIPFVWLFDLSVLAVRLPSAILSSLSILTFYFLVKEIFKDGGPTLNINSIKVGVAEISSLLLVVSPWHIYISRLGHEVNAFLAFLIFGLLFFLRSVNGKPWNLIFSSVFLALSFNSYQSGKIVIPAILITLFALFFKKVVENKSHFILSLVLGVILILPTVVSSFEDNSLIRYKATSIFENSQDYFEDVSKRYAQDLENNNFLGTIFDNRKVASAVLVSRAYLSHFDPVWLHLNKGDEPFKAPSSSLLYLLQLPFIFFGILYFLKGGIEKKYYWLIIILGLVSILPGSITTGYPHAMRSIGLIISLQILSALGFLKIVEVVRDKKIKIGIISVSIFLFIVSIAWFYHSYFYLLPRELSHHFQYGPSIAFSEAKELEQSYQKVVVSNKGRLFESYMFYLFLNKKDPENYQKAGGTVSGGFSEEHRIGKYFFGDVSKNISKNSLYIISPEEQTTEMEIVKAIKYPNGETAILITQIK